VIVLSVPIELIVGIVIGLLLAMLLFGGQNLVGQIGRASPCSCLFGVVCIVAGIVLLIRGGYPPVR
jgi:ABC-type sulfate transport system permease subunit